MTAPVPPEVQVETVARALTEPMPEWRGGPDADYWRMRAAAAIAALPPSPADGHDIVVDIYDGLDISMRCITCRERIAVRPESAAASMHELYRLADDHVRAALASPAPAPQGEEPTDCGCGVRGCVWGHGA